MLDVTSETEKEKVTQRDNQVVTGKFLFDVTTERDERGPPFFGFEGRAFTTNLAWNENVDEASQIARSMIRKAPDCHLGYYWLGIKRSKVPDIPGAREAFRQGLATARQKSGLYFQLGKVEMSDNCMEDAIRCWINAVLCHHKERSDASMPLYYLAHSAKFLFLLDIAEKMRSAGQANMDIGRSEVEKIFHGIRSGGDSYLYILQGLVKEFSDQHWPFKSQDESRQGAI
jgi:hypothetical protein